ncbi:MAG: DMT family transporter [Deltaproteobacteria bacterium]|nr:DMT family transporter [Deltaproteobacteria bacterium]
MVWVLVSMALGVASVMQGVVNRQITSGWGIAAVTLLNTVVLFCVAGIFYGLSRYLPQLLPELLRERFGDRTPVWWYFVPGLCGFVIVVGLPLAIEKIGALRVFLGFVAAQIVVSLVWDLTVEKIPVSLTRVAGALIAWAGVLLAGWKR